MTKLSPKNHFISVARVGTTADYEPFTYFTQASKNYTGFDIELVQLLSEELGIKTQLIKTTWANLEKNLADGLFDMAVGGISLTESRKQNFLTSSPIILDGKTMLIRRECQNTIKTIRDLDSHEMTIVVNRGGTNEIFVKNNINKAKIIVIDDNTLIFAKLANGEADAIITDRLEALYRQNLDHRLYVADPVNLLTEPIGNGFIYNKNNTELRDIIETRLADFIAKDKFKTLFTKFFDLRGIYELQQEYFGRI